MKHSFYVRIVLDPNEDYDREDRPRLPRIAVARRLSAALEHSTVQEALAEATNSAVSFVTFDEGPEAQALRDAAWARHVRLEDSITSQEHAPVTLDDEFHTGPNEEPLVSGSVMIWEDTIAPAPTVDHA